MLVKTMLRKRLPWNRSHTYRLILIWRRFIRASKFGGIPLVKQPQWYSHQQFCLCISLRQWNEVLKWKINSFFCSIFQTCWYYEEDHPNRWRRRRWIRRTHVFDHFFEICPNRNSDYRVRFYTEFYNVNSVRYNVSLFLLNVQENLIGFLWKFFLKFFLFVGNTYKFGFGLYNPGRIWK